MLIYKCEKYGLNFKVVNEAYTSKVSSIDDEPVYRQDTYKGKRVTRGVFKSSNGTLINADVNAAYNILRKANFTLDVISTKVNKLTFSNPSRIQSNPSKMGYSGPLVLISLKLIQLVIANSIQFYCIEFEYTRSSTL